MAYKKRNYYEKVLEVQQITIRHQKLGKTNTYIFNTYIKNKYFISKRTFDEYLGIPAEFELKKIEEHENTKNKRSKGSGSPGLF